MPLKLIPVNFNHSKKWYPHMGEEEYDFMIDDSEEDQAIYSCHACEYTVVTSGFAEQLVQAGLAIIEENKPSS